MSENVVVYFFKVGKRQGLEQRFGTNKAFTTLYGRSREWAKGGVYLSLLALQMMATTLYRTGVCVRSRYTSNWQEQKPYPLKTVFVILRDLCNER